MAWAENIKAIAESVAVTCTGLFFAWKLYSGYQVVNLSLSVECKRTRRDSKTDYLVTNAILNKGERGSVEIHDAKARFTVSHQDPIIKSFDGFERSSYRTETIASGHQR